MDFLPYLPLVVVPAVALVAAITDAWNFKIYNTVTIPLIVSGIIFHTAFYGWSGLVNSIAGFGFGFLLLLFPYVLGAMGAGDVKLMAGVGAWLGPSSTVTIFFIAAVAAALYSAIIVFRRGTAGNMLTGLKILSYQVSTMGRHLGAQEGVEFVVQQSDRRKRLIPFAVMIAIAAAVTSYIAWEAT